MCKSILLCLLLAGSSMPCFSQINLRGFIFDAETNTPVENAFVFFAEGHAGALSDSKGVFQLKVPSGRVLLQVSHLGYQNQFLPLLLPADSVVRLALIPSYIPMKEIVVTGNILQAPGESTFNTSQLTQTQMIENGALSISDAVSRLPGISQLTTGVGISKPVIRGLSGNRIQVNVNGLRFDNQQWQDEHGLGLSDMGVDRVEIIKGPVAVLYGSDAMGGVLNVIEEKPAPVGTTERDLNARLFSNTYGISLDYGVKKSVADKWKKFRVGFVSHADYNDGNSERVLNSRFATYNLKATWGKKKSGNLRVWNLFTSFSEFGFVFDSLSRKETDARLSRRFDGPHHLVGIIQLGNEKLWHRGLKKIKLNTGLTSNLRMEDEGGGGISLSMLLNTLSLAGQVNRSVGTTGDWTFGSSVMLQTNTNFGGRIIIPDALTGEASAFTFYKVTKNKLLAEGGVRIDGRFVGTYATASLNVIGNESPTEEILPFNKAYTALNASAGLTYSVTQHLSVKGNVSSGYRPGNLAELSSNGLHEGTLRWEIGLPDATIEQNVNAEASVIYTLPSFIFSGSLYRNTFWNYFYLSPTGDEYFGFSVYHYRQSDATLEGGELSVDIDPLKSPIGLHASYSGISAKKQDGSYLPFIPANRFTGELKFHLPETGRLQNPMLRLGASYTLGQNRPAEFETSTSAYWLFHASATADYKKVRIILSGTNLSDKYYYDHLSRFKYYGIGNIGRSITLSINYRF